ncbi:ArsR family transcriptional regulator [Halanaerobium saccharolyticum]|uniref:ArsR family transcriptional regulator n=1 Tax=Halanaerobium saccharolyticum TaxID=43595 RepID=A0A4R7YTQ5_9FIRM|nr:metalloregulator ArsR/SmtB family transcription factor [Halanaerobium saccharolyticum]RAK06637.1 ArsR family transcriptional regulator [Halanaerobium saccharolyticum]TDW01176.1 ArsR family transcriptional regulator [Halanaerobium saccharolyticum]TDX51468.1 ArsR family transcriptional regulator [Halanaerobium saccharolyticum]
MVDNKKIVKLLKAIADENRLQIINLLSCESLCSCHFVNILEISQPNVSHHLKILKEARLIKASKRGRWIDYSLNEENIALIKNELNNILTNYEEDCQCTKINCD